MNKSKRAHRFFEAATAKYGQKFSYQDDYVSTHTHMTITCPIHGEFRQTPAEHLQRMHGCSKCADAAMGQLQKKNAWEKFLLKAPQIHDNKYTYKNAVYTGMHDKIEVTCPDHGAFFVSPTHHITMCVGCPICSRQRRTIYNERWFEKNSDAKNIPALVYAFEGTINGDAFVKIGITQIKSAATRLKAYRNEGVRMLRFVQVELPLYEAFQLEQKLLTDHADHQIIPITKFSGYTECLAPTQFQSVCKQLFS